MQKVFEDTKLDFKETLLNIQWSAWCNCQCMGDSPAACLYKLPHLEKEKRGGKKKRQRCEKHQHKWKCSHSLWLVAQRVVVSTPQFLVERLPGTKIPMRQSCIMLAVWKSQRGVSRESVRLHRENMLLSALDDVLPVNMQATRLAAESSCSVSDPQNVIRSVWLWSVGVWC